MSPALAFALWGLFLAALMTLGAVVWGFPDPEVPALFGGAALLMWVLAAVIALRRLGAPRPETPTAAASLSPPAVWLAASLTLLALSARLGLWLALIAGGMTAVGLAGLVREWMAQRAAVRRVEHAGAGTGRRAAEE